jgi:OmcA/MtrC family decaheme c-type cytochrome
MKCKTKSLLFKSILLTTFLGLSGCGDDGKDADPAITDALQAQLDAIAMNAAPESCAICHSGDIPFALGGAGHQADYDQYYQDQVLRVINLNYSNDGTNDIVTFDMTKKNEVTGLEENFDCRDATTNPEPGLSDALNIYYTEFTDPGFEILTDVGGPGFAYNWVSLKDTLTYDDAGGCTSTKAQSALGNLNDGGENGVIAVYGRDETLSEDTAKHIANPKFPFATILKLGTVGYVSKANASGCENCHTRPFLKHAYVYGEVNDGTNNDGNDFYVCKSCHIDNGVGGHEGWQILKDDPARYAAIDAGDPMTAAEEAKYAYKTSLMNDVHMSHNMEFGYPQSMKNCATCHEGNLDAATGVVADANFIAETCISCHAVDGLLAKMKTTEISVHNTFDETTLRDVACNDCHTATAPTIPGAPLLGAIHTGYDPEIYADAIGSKYSEIFTITIDTATIAGNQLTVEFSAAESPDIAAFDPVDIVPTLMIGLYGYDTKDFIFNGHRDLEYNVGEGAKDRFTEDTTVAAGSWKVTVDLSTWADMITAGSVRRVEVIVLPALGVNGPLDVRGGTGEYADDNIVAVNAVSRTFDLTILPDGDFVDGFYPSIVKVDTGCNSCHDALATTFHDGKRGGSIVACRFCHNANRGGSHLEMQSRSIDSYVHAVHSFQAFDPGDINFNDPVEKMEYDHKINSEFPTFGIKNCESCHNPGTYEVPDQSKSLPGRLSAADISKDGSWIRDIGAVPGYVVGPASRACGSCHRADMINADDAGRLAAFNAHTAANGYLIEDDGTVLDAIVDKIMSVF